MAILNFDYKIKAVIKPMVYKYFQYAIYVDVTYSDGKQVSEKVFEDQSFITTWHDSLNAAKELSDQTVEELAQAGVDALKAKDPGLTINRYYLYSLNPSVSVICYADGTDKPLAWSAEMSQPDVDVETHWMMGPQVDTSLYYSEDHMLCIATADSIKDLLERNSLIPLPKDYEILSLEVISNNEQIVVVYDLGIYVFGIEGYPTQNIQITADTDYLQMIKGEEEILNINVQGENPFGIQTDGISYYFEDPTIVEVVEQTDGQLKVRGLKAGTTILHVYYHGTYFVDVKIDVVDPKGRLTITKSKERSFAGDTTEIHLAADYENGDRFEIQMSSLQLDEGQALIEKIDEATYRITPQQGGETLSMSLQVSSPTGDTVSATVKLPVWEKKLYRFHVLPSTASVIKGQSITFEAFYEMAYPDMEHHDSEIVWEVVEGQELVTISSNKGKTCTVKAQGQGNVTIKASVYGSEVYSDLKIEGELDKILHVTPSRLQLAPGEQKTIYAQVLNTEEPTSVEWDVQDNGIIKVIKQGDTFIQVEALVNGDALITARSGDLEQQAVIEVSEYFITMMDNPDPIAVGEEPSSEVYFPTEDNEEQWTDPKFEPNYIDGKGSSTILYGRAHGAVDPAYAFKSGIGDNDDLMVKKPESENTVQAFQYAARLRGRRKHQIMIYPEINFQYSIQYKGDLFVTYNESAFKVGIDAYPAKRFDFTILEERKLPTQRDYEVRMDIAGTVAQKTLEYAVKWEASYPQTVLGDLKAMFTTDGTGKGIYVGYGNDIYWKFNGSYVYQSRNVPVFTGVINKDYYWTSGEVSIDFKPIFVDYQGWDDDLIGFIFKAKDERNFYVLLMEGNEMVRDTGVPNMRSDRIGEIDGLNVFTSDQSAWTARLVDSSPYRSSDSLWRIYCDTKGWGTKHNRIYKVTNGVLQRVNVSAKTDSGWIQNTLQNVTIQASGRHVIIKFNGAVMYEFDTDWDQGSFGLANWSQAVEVHKIQLTKWDTVQGRIPETGWDTYNQSGSKTISPNANMYVAPHILPKLPAGITTYTITSITGEVHDSSAGSIECGLNQPIVVKTYNAPNAGQPVTASYTKKGTATVTPDNINPSVGCVVFEDVNDFFRAEIASFKAAHPELAASSVQPQFTLVTPAPGDPEYQWDGKKLVFWKGEFPTDSMTKDYSVSVYAYQGWVEARDLSEFRGGKWAKYTVTFHDNSQTVNPKYDSWKWKIAGATNVSTNDRDVLMLKTTEWYQGTFPADIHNEGVVNSDQPSYVEIPPDHEHYVEPNEGTPMPGIFDHVDYLLRMYPVGKPSYVWMYWEGYPGITTRNAKSPLNAMTGEPVIKTDRQNDRVVIKCDPDPRYVPWTSGKYIGYGKVNGKRPFFGPGAGKANMIDVPTDVVFLPPNLINIQGPFIEVDDPRVEVTYDAFKKTANFSSDFQDAYVWYTDWYTDWVEDPRSFRADLNTITEINDTVGINPMLSPDYDNNVVIDHVEVVSNNPFVATWVETQEGDANGLLGTYYKYPQRTENIREGFVVGGDYHVKEQTFHIGESQTGVQVDGQPATEVFLLASNPVRGTVHAKEVIDALSVYVPEGQSELKICGSFMVGTGDHYPDLQVISPFGESFGIQFNNGTWSLDPISISTFASGEDIISCSLYEYSGDKENFEIMTFKNPVQGTWKIQVFNQGIQDSDYCITTNIGTDVVTQVQLAYAPDPWSVKVSVNGTLITDFTLDEDLLQINAPINKEDIVRVDYTAGGYKVDDLPMQSAFDFFDNPPFTILSVTKNGIEIPESDTNGYTVEGKTFKAHGSYLTPGDIKVRYATGTLNNVFTLTKEVGEGAEVYLNGVKLDSTKYSLSGNTLVVDRSILHPKDWVHVQSYKVIGNFDVTKENYLGEAVFQRIDPFINFNWGYGSPFEETPSEPVGSSSVEDVQIMEEIPDNLTFEFDLDCDITYPSNETIDLSNFTGVWKKFDENVGTDVGDWHGPPESGYPEVTNLANQNYRSGWYNPDHVGFTDYTFSFKVQVRDDTDDDMYGAMFRFDPNTFNFYSFEMDAYVSRGSGGTGVQGMALYRNICTNPSQYGVARLNYNKVQLAHLPEGWTWNANEINEIKVQLIGRMIKVYVNGVEKFSVVDDSPDALLQGAWGPITQSQPHTYFWDFKISKLMTYTWEQDASLRHHIQKQLPRPVDDTTRTLEMVVDDNEMRNEFNAEIQNFLAAHPDLTLDDLSFAFRINNDSSDASVYFQFDRTVKILELTPSKLQPNPLGKTFIQQAVEKYGNFSEYEKVSVTQDIYENWYKYNVDDFDVLTFTPADCNANVDLVSDEMMNWVRQFKLRGKVIIFSHDTGIGAKPRFRTLLAEFGFTIDDARTWSGIWDKATPKVIQDWMKYPYDLAREINITPSHTTSVYGGTEAYMFSGNPTYAYLKYVGNIFYSETGHSHYNCDGTFHMQGSDDEMKLWINLMMKVATWRNDKSRKTVTDNRYTKVFADVTTVPRTAPPVPGWQDYRHDTPTYPTPAYPLDVYTPDLPEPYIDPIIPPMGPMNDGFAVNWRGNIFAPETGEYKFHVTVDDGFRLRINNQLIIDEWHDSPGNTYTGSIYLEGGKWYDFNATYFENQGVASVKLEWTPPGGQRGLITSDYFTPITGYKVLARVREATPLPWNPMIHNGYYYFQEHEHFLYATKVRHVKTPVDNQILITPRPQQGAAIIVRDNEGNNLRKVSFFEEVYDDKGQLIGVNQTLENKEVMNGNGFSKYYLQYRDIDPDTLVVILNGVTLDPDQYLFDSKNSSIEFMKNLDFSDIIECRYKLLYSYYVDYNYDVENDVAKIVLHSKYDPEKMKDMEIIYEGDSLSPFYRAEEVSFNPILNHNHRGFLYITNKIYVEPKSLEINLSPNTLPANGVGKVLVTGKVLDKYNNPVQNKQVDIYRDGELIFSGKTNRAGEVYLYDKPIVRGDFLTRYQIVCDDLQNLALLHYYKSDVSDRCYLELKTSKAAILAGQEDEATITITLRDENWSVIQGQQLVVTVKDTKGITRSLLPTTDDFGQAAVTVSGLDQQQGVITVSASYTRNGETESNFIFLKVLGA
jgi:hypothetical protein